MTAITGPRTEGWRLTWTSGTDAVDLPLILYSGGHDWHIDRAIPLGMSCQLGPRLADGSPLPDLRDGWIHGAHIINGTAHPIGKFKALGRPRHLSRTGDTYSLSAADPTCLLDRAGDLGAGRCIGNAEFLNGRGLIGRQLHWGPIVDRQVETPLRGVVENRSTRAIRR